VVKLDMVALGGPVLYYVDTPEGLGVTGVQIITTSTITFHGDADGNCIYVDVFSCKEYEPKTALDLINVYFSPKSVKKHWIVRNAEFDSI
jgi:S-adenosylmethionine/arginine decarboxylase-like enzyme